MSGLLTRMAFALRKIRQISRSERSEAKAPRESVFLIPIKILLPGFTAMVKKEILLWLTTNKSNCYYEIILLSLPAFIQN